MSWNSSLTERNLAELFASKCVNVDTPFIFSDDGRTFTFEGFHRLAGQLAQQLLCAGARAGDRIAVQAEKSVEVIALFWACARAGLIFLPLNTAYTASEISYFLSDAEAAVFITTPQR